MQTIKVHTKEVYGRTLHYPVCALSQMLVKLSGSKTFTPETLKMLEDAGYAVEHVTPDHSHAG